VGFTELWVIWVKQFFLKIQLHGFWRFHGFSVVSMITARYCPHQVNTCIENFVNS